MVERFKGKIVKKEVRGNRFHFVLDKKLDFKAGQFLNVILEKNGKKLVRQYSIASAPGELIELYIKKVDEGVVSSYLYDLNEGDEINLIGPLGIFTLDKSSKSRDIVFVAIGTGISPIRSMIKELLKEGFDKNIYLFYGNRYENDFFFNEEFKSLEREITNFYYFPIISRPTDNWNGFNGHIQKHFDKVENLGNKEFFICASPFIVPRLEISLKVKGAKEELIFVEKF